MKKAPLILKAIIILLISLNTSVSYAKDKPVDVTEVLASGKIISTGVDGKTHTYVVLYKRALYHCLVFVSGDGWCKKVYNQNL